MPIPTNGDLIRASNEALAEAGVFEHREYMGYDAPREWEIRYGALDGNEYETRFEAIEANLNYLTQPATGGEENA